MPTSLYVKGLNTYRPGVYHAVTIEEVGGGLAGYGIIVVVGKFKRGGEPDKVHVVTNPSQFIPLFGKELGYKLRETLWNAALDNRVPNKPMAVYYVRVNKATQASITMLDTNSNPIIELDAFDWGAIGNNISVKYSADSTLTAKFRDPDNPYHDVIETFDMTGLDNAWMKLNLNNFAALFSSGPTPVFKGYMLPNKEDVPTDYTDMWGEGKKGLFIMASQTFEFADSGTDFSYNSVPVKESIYFVASNPAAGDNVIIEGFDADGTVLTETVLLESGHGHTTKNFAVITKITPTFTGAGGTVTATMSCIEYEDEEGDRTLADAYTYLEGHNIDVEIPDIRNSKRLLSDLDWDIGKTLTANKWDLTAKVTQFVESVNEHFSLFEATRIDSIDAGLPDTSDSWSVLEGGDDKIIETLTPDWTEGFDKLKDVSPVDVIVPLTGKLEVWKSLKSHMEWRATTGHDPGIAIVGVETVPDREVVLGGAGSAGLAANINSPYMAIIPVQAKSKDAGGHLIVEPGYYLALRAAAMIAGTAVATPLTHKYINILDVVDKRTESTIAKAWNIHDDVEFLLKGGLLFPTRGITGGFRWERGITSYIQDDNYVYSEISANESLNMSIKDLERYLDRKIGDPGTPILEGIIKQMITRRLNWQTDMEIIKGWDKKSLTLTDNGNGFDVGYACAVIEPNDFIVLNIFVARNAV